MYILLGFVRVRIMANYVNQLNDNMNHKQGKSEGSDSCSQPSNLTQIGFKSSIKQSWGWWVETPSCQLWCHCNGNLAKSHGTLNGKVYRAVMGFHHDGWPSGLDTTPGMRHDGTDRSIYGNVQNRTFLMTLQWHHNERDCVSNNQCLNCLLAQPFVQA